MKITCFMYNSSMSSKAELAVERLLGRLAARGVTFRPYDNNMTLLELYRRKLGEPVTNKEALAKVKSSAMAPITRLQKDLKRCFEKDRSLWDDDQQMLELCEIRSREFGAGTEDDEAHTLKLQPLCNHLSATSRIWFHQCLRVPIPKKDEKAEAAREEAPTIVLSEPCFFYSSSLKAYVRFLDINHDDVFQSVDEGKLLVDARERLAAVMSGGKPNKRVNNIVNGLGLLPVRLYLPAGDSYGKTAIRRWFRDAYDIRVGYMESSSLTKDESLNQNLIILASRSSHPLVAHFQEENKPRLQLTDKGICFDGQLFEDETTPNKGTTLSRVIVTNWLTFTNKVHTYLLTNHTRALQKVAELLVDDSSRLLNDVTDRLVELDGVPYKVPGRFQMAFEVELSKNETKATVKQMLPALNGKPLVYD